MRDERPPGLTGYVKLINLLCSTNLLLHLHLFASFLRMFSARRTLELYSLKNTLKEFILINQFLLPSHCTLRFFMLPTHHILTVQFRRLLLVKKRSVAFCVNLPSTHDCIIKCIHSTSYICLYACVWTYIYSESPSANKGLPRWHDSTFQNISLIG